MNNIHDDQQQSVKNSLLISPDDMIARHHCTIIAHQIFPLVPEYAISKLDGTIPYVVHCQLRASLVISEVLLNPEVRKPCYTALLMQDILTLTKAALPDSLDPKIVELIYELNSAKGMEAKEMLEPSKLCKLCQLYDLVCSCLFSIDWIEPEELSVYRNYLIELNKFVKAEYGELGIISIAEMVIGKFDAKIATI